MVSWLQLPPTSAPNSVSDPETSASPEPVQSRSPGGHPASLSRGEGTRPPRGKAKRANTYPEPTGVRGLPTLTPATFSSLAWGTAVPHLLWFEAHSHSPVEIRVP